MKQTIIEKLISSKAGYRVKSGDLVLAHVDLLVCHDGNRPQALDIFKELGGKRMFDPQRVKFVMDHAPGVPNQSAAAIHLSMRTFAKEQGSEVIHPGEGICHQIMPERGYVLPGDFILGTDSHTCTYGAFNAFGTGVGSSDLAAAMLTGQTWLYVPETIRVELVGELPPGVFAKDIVLSLVRKLKADGATYKAIEFGGDALQHISVSGRMTIANMGVEMGAKAAIFPFDSVLETWLKERAIQHTFRPVEADQGAAYSQTMVMDISELQPQVSAHPTVDHVVDLEAVEGLSIQQAVIGTCTNGRLEDLREAAYILKGKRIHSDVRLFVTPASREVYQQALKEGLIEIFVEAGAVIGVPGCSGCSGGAHFAIPSDGERVITTANRNFIGRLGNPKAEIYLASPATVAQSALSGHISSASGKGRIA